MNKEDIRHFFETLQAANPHPRSDLHYRNPFELLIAVMLSAQATDTSVNKASPALFAAAPTPQAMCALGLEALQAHIKTIGLYRSKARHILQSCRILIDEHASQVPHSRAALERLPGVGRKTANVVLNVAFGQAVVAVDTHIFRVCNRTGLARATTPLGAEKKLMGRIAPAHMQHAHHWLLLHGRYVCKARAPQCAACAVAAWCDMGKSLAKARRREKS